MTKFSRKTSIESVSDSSLSHFDSDDSETEPQALNAADKGKPTRFRIAGISYPARRYFQGKHDIQRPDSRVGRRQWIIGRGLCLYRTFNLAEVPASERKNALSVRILQWSPFLQTGQYISWKGDIALVWIWDELLRMEEMRSIDVNSATALPESVLNPPSDDVISQLVVCKEGFEGQIWNNGLLVASRWWEEMPQSQEWSRFLIANDMAPGASSPLVEEYEWLSSPWARRSSGFDVLDFRTERFWIIIGLLVFSGIFIWKGVELWRLHEGIAALSPEMKVLSQQTRPLKNARAKALRYKDESNLLLGLVDYPSPLALFHEAVRLFPGSDVEIIEWRYMKNELEFIVKGKNLNPVTFINAFQESPLFKDITAEKKGADRLRMHMLLTPRTDSNE